MKSLQHKCFMSLTAFVITLIGCMFLHMPVQAASHDITVNNGDSLSISVYLGDTGTFTPNISTISTDNLDGYSVDSLVWSYDYDTGNGYLSFNEISHSFTALQIGTTTFHICAYTPNDYSQSYPVFSAYVTVKSQVDMTNVTLSQNAYTTYLSPIYYEGSKKPVYSNNSSDFLIGINSSYIFGNSSSSDSYYGSYDNDLYTYSYTQNTKVQMSITLTDNQFHVNLYPTGKITKSFTSVLTITLCDKTFQVPIRIIPLTISNQTCLLVKGKKTSFKVNNESTPIEWTSSNPKIATVNSKGVVKGKKYGSCIIIGKVGNGYVGCAVSVTTSKLKKVATYARYMGRHWKYSQAKRTQKGYYDCSALVWKAYKRYTSVRFGSSGYPGVALSEAKWCKSKKRMIKGGFRYKKVSQMYYRPGDLVFKSTNMKKKYQDIYHVEMITGYYCYGVSSSGEVYYDITWGARGAGYGALEGSLVGRPMK